MRMTSTVAAGFLMTLPIACSSAGSAPSSGAVKPTAGAVAVTPPASVPANLNVPAGHALVLKALARGVQVYVCTPTGWTLKAPDAELFDEKGNKIGHHSAGPTWELADGSAVVGEMKEKAPADGTIPWLLLARKSVRGEGTLSRVTFIQRLETQGGKPPADGNCAGAPPEARIDYSATYYFYAAR
jgi:hypothetical protein